MFGVFKKKTDLPEYLTHYGMFRAPFSSAVEDEMYYADPVRQQRLDILLHLTQNTSELLVVIGEEGMGKTTFLNQFLHSAADHWKLCYIESHKMMSEEQFLERVYLGFNIAHASINKGTMLSNLRKRLEKMLEEAIPVILVIDNAHLFSTKVLALILDIASIKNTKSGSSVRVILASEPQIKILLAEPALDELHSLIVRKIDLPPLDETHTGNYLHHRLTQAGMMVEQFLTKPTITKIFRKSEGVPRRINEEADRLLFETTPIIRRTSNVQPEKHSSGFKLVLIIIAITVIAAIAAIAVSNSNESPWHEDVPVVSEETTTPLTLPPINSLPDSDSSDSEVKKKDDPVDPMQSLKDELASKSTNTQDTSTKTTSGRFEKDEPVTPAISLPQLAASDQNTVAEPEKPAEPSSTQDLAVQTQTEKTASTAVLATAEPSTKSSSTAEATDKDISALKNSEWILLQNPNTYTVQLVAGIQQNTIQNFIKIYDLKGDLLYFSAQRNGKLWHNLTYGVFVNQKDASKAVKNLPADVVKLKPWIRQMKAIQSEIKNTPR